MSDLLIRNIDFELKRRLTARARRSGRSLSEEAKVLIKGALAQARTTPLVGSALVKLFEVVRPVELEIPRDEKPRQPPAFE